MVTVEWLMWLDSFSECDICGPRACLLPVSLDGRMRKTLDANNMYPNLYSLL